MNNNIIIDQINQSLMRTDIDERVKPFLYLYFLGKINIGEMKLENLDAQMKLLCSKISNVEFTSSNIVAAFSSKADVLTINKKLIADGKCDDVILPVFMKFESALNQNNRRDFSNYIEDFIRAGRVAIAESVPISPRLYKLYEMSEFCYGDSESNVGEIQKDSSWKATCYDYNCALNKSIVSGKDDINGLIDGARLFHYKVFTGEMLNNPNFIGEYDNEEYRKKAAKVLSYINGMGIDLTQDMLNGLIEDIKLFTGCSESMINEEKNIKYVGNPNIKAAIEKDITRENPELSEEYIKSKVQMMLNKKEHWDDRIKHLIIPFFTRSQKIYNWDADQFQERLNEVNLKIDDIVFKNLGSITNMGDTSSNKIQLNSLVFLNGHGKISWPVEKTLFHELGHNTDENSREGIISKERLQDASLGNCRFYEWTNSVFESLACRKKFYKNQSAMQLVPSGYEALAPLGSMLSSALGMSEAEFAKIKDKGRRYEQELFDEKFPATHSDIQQRYKQIKEMFNKYELSTGLSIKKKENNQSLLNEIYNNCLEIMKERVSMELNNGNIKDISDYQNKQDFFLKKTNFNYEHACVSKIFACPRVPIIHKMENCSDNLSIEDEKKISNEFCEAVDFGFDKDDLNKYRSELIIKKRNYPPIKRSLFIPRAWNVQQDESYVEKPIEKPIEKLIEKGDKER